MNRNAMRLPGLLRMGLLALALGAADQPLDYEAIRRRRLDKIRSDLLDYGLTEDEATAEVERLDREAIEMAGSEGADWSRAMDQALRYRRARLLLARGAEVIADGKLAQKVQNYQVERTEVVADAARLNAPCANLESAYATIGDLLCGQVEQASGVTVDLDKIPDPSRATVEEIAAAADPPGSLTVTADGRLAGRGVLEAIDRRTTVGGATMVEVNRRRREAGELGTKRQRKARKGRR